MEKLTFDELPNLINTLKNRVERLEKAFGQFSSSDNQKELLTVKEAAELLDLSVTTIYILKYKKRIPFHKGGGRLYFLRKELIQWITARPESAKKSIIKNPKK